MCDSDDAGCGCDIMLESNDVRTGIISGDNFKNRTVQYAAVDGLAIFEGCIVLGTVDEVEASTALAKEALDAEGSDTDIAHGVVLTGSGKRWKNGLMPYEIDPGLANQARVTDAIDHWTQNTGLRFVRRTSANASQYPDYVRFRTADGCWSSVGKRGGRQDIGLAPGCGLGATIHEIGHAFGLWHEQSREDRDSKVRINWQNIQSGKEHNFNQHISDGDDVGPYDYGSIMHYSRFAFSKNGQPTIESIPPGRTLGQRNGLSPGDIAAVESIYQLWKTVDVGRVFTTHEAKNCWVAPSGEGWLRIDNKTEDGCSNMFEICCYAKAFGKKVSLLRDGSKIYQAQLR